MSSLTPQKTDIRNFSLEELSAYLVSIGEKPFRAIQIFEWIYQKNAWAFDTMANLPKDTRLQGDVLRSITSNRAFEEWAEVFGNDLLASAALDRLTHHTHTLTIRGSSYRQRQRRKEEPSTTTTLATANET